MEITFEEGLNNLIELQKDYQQFHDDVWQDPESYGIITESLRIGIDTMRKYQKIEDIVRNYYNEQYTDKLDIEIIEKISEVIEDGKID